ncbi:hypothetical protein B0T09DRAFT_320309 [Sordaria sp. MPI-SDFR-AT-0083]|nr:hypothetical protein B0T09DRAFT_320309 [Sordaria sp. MPI-SDFR-AT-0083]
MSGAVVQRPTAKLIFLPPLPPLSAQTQAQGQHSSWTSQPLRTPSPNSSTNSYRRQGIQLKGTLNAVSTLEKNSADGDDGRISPGPSSPGHYESYETSTSGHKFAKHYLGDGERCESTGVSGENEEQYRGSGSSPESQKRQRVR